MSAMTVRDAEARPSGVVGLRVVRKSPWGPARILTREEIDHYSKPQRGLDDEVNDWRSDNQKHFKRGLRPVLLARRLRLPHFYGSVFFRRISDGVVTDFGLASMAVVTNNGVGFIVDAFQNLKELEDMKYHGLGTGSGAEAAGDSILNAELSTAYNNSGDIRATGTLGEGASANIYRTVATNTVDAAVAITEHGIFSQSATGAASAANVLLDRSLFAAVNLAIGDQLQSTYDLTIAAGG